MKSICMPLILTSKFVLTPPTAFVIFGTVVYLNMLNSNLPVTLHVKMHVEIIPIEIHRQITTIYGEIKNVQKVQILYTLNATLLADYSTTSSCFYHFCCICGYF